MKSLASLELQLFLILQGNRQYEILVLMKSHAVSSLIVLISLGTPGKVRIVNPFIGSQIIPGAVPRGLLII